MPLADGRGARIETAGRVDLVYLSDSDFADGARFRGTTGLSVERGNDVTLALGAAGRIATRGRSLEAGKVSSERCEADACKLMRN